MAMTFYYFMYPTRFVYDVPRERVYGVLGDFRLKGGVSSRRLVERAFGPCRCFCRVSWLRQ